MIATEVDKRMGNAGLGQRLCAALLSCGCQEGQTVHSHREGRSWMLLACWLEMLSVSCWLEMVGLGNPFVLAAIRICYFINVNQKTTRLHRR
jgi:hypothetical protein